jgi:SsrA-binding protein
MKVLAKNKRSTYDYQINERLVAGLVLSGDEVKSIKAAHASLKGTFIALQNDEAWLVGAHVSPYDKSSVAGEYQPTRNRKLLLHRRQIDQLSAEKRGGRSVVPTALLLDRNLIKLEIGIGTGKKRYDKRAAIKARDTAREIARSVAR